ncbi:MAG: diguanylate cyclase [Eubacteriales bacterium]|nr:diguanylate cyclase [Eubacteriales bacterium]
MDLKTAFFGTLIVFLMTALALIWLWLQHRKHFQGLHFLPLASAVVGLASTLIFFRQQIPDWASVVLANLLLFLVPVLIRKGFAAFFGLSASWGGSYGIVVLGTLVQTYFTYVQPDLSARLHTYGLVFGLLTGQLFSLLIRSVPPYYQTQLRPISLSLIVMILGLVARSIVLAIDPVTRTTQFLDRNVDAYFILVMMGFWILFTFALMILVSRRLMDEVNLERLKFDTMFHQSGDASTLVRLNDTVISDVNESFEHLSGLSRQSLIGQPVKHFNYWADPGWLETLQRELRTGTAITSREAMFRRKSGEVVPVLYSGKVIEIEGMPYVLSNIQDISEIYALKSRLEKMATYDALTRLPNRVLFADRFTVASAGALRAGRKFALAIFDLDDFKFINDTYGHDVGDLLLMAAADRISRYIRLSDTVARFGGDEFVLLLTDVLDQASVADALKRIVELYREPFEINGMPLKATVSIGAALFPDDADNLTDLLRLSDRALFQVKRQGKNGWSLYESDTLKPHALVSVGSGR